MIHNLKYWKRFNNNNLIHSCQTGIESMLSTEAHSFVLKSSPKFTLFYLLLRIELQNWFTLSELNMKKISLWILCKFPGFFPSSRSSIQNCCHLLWRKARCLFMIECLLLHKSFQFFSVCFTYEKVWIKNVQHLFQIRIRIAIFNHLFIYRKDKCDVRLNIIIIMDVIGPTNCE